MKSRGRVNATAPGPLRSPESARGQTVPTKKTRSRAGFSLMEVSLAILLVAIGLLTLFSLFPLGLREGQMAVVDTQEAMFSDQVLNGIKANAQDVAAWTDWTNLPRLIRFLAEGIYPLDKNTGGPGWVSTNRAIAFPVPDPRDPIAVTNFLKYRVTIPETNQWPRARARVIVEVKSGPYALFVNPQVYATDIMFMGM